MNEQVHPFVVLRGELPILPTHITAFISVFYALASGYLDSLINLWLVTA